MDKTTTEQLAAINKSYKEIDGIYHHYAKFCHLSDAGFWVLYSLWEQGARYSQRDLCNQWFFSPQTINSALKTLEKQGLISLELTPGNRKRKDVALTEKGRALGKKVLAPVFGAEAAALLALSEDEREVYLALTQKYTDALKGEVALLMENPPVD